MGEHQEWRIARFGRKRWLLLLTCDRNIQHQQNTADLHLALVVLAVPNKKLDTIRPLVPDILAVLATNPQPGTLSVVGSWRV